MSFLQKRFQRCLPLCGWLLAGVFFAGCGHLYYVDPNPTAQFVFPGQNPPSPTGSQSTMTGPSLAPVNTAPGAPPTSAPPTPSHTFAEVLGVGDSVTISFSDIPSPGILPVVQRIGNDGKISGLPFDIKVAAAGKTVSQLQDDIRAAYVPKYYRFMSCSVKNEERVFFVEGEVKLASRLPYVGEMTVLRAITSAGGFTDFANRKNIELHRATGQKLTINWYKAIEDPKLDKPVFPNDQIIVRKKYY
jgi:protein involved in polysaccharide export with SLBB domain